MLFKAYTARKRSVGVLDLDDLLLYWRALARDDVIGPAIERSIDHVSIDHVSIDEYQDVNGLQVDLIRALRRKREDVTCASALPDAAVPFPARGRPVRARTVALPHRRGAADVRAGEAQR